MRLDKIKNTFNDYKLELSWGQLEAIRGALESDHTDPVKDEMLAEFQWYMDRVPGPGEEEADVKGREEGGAPVPTEGGEEGDFPIPMPPTEGAAQAGGEPPSVADMMPGGPGEGGEGGEGGEPGVEQPPAEDMPQEMGDLGGGAEPPAEPSEADNRLPEPPAE